MQKIKQILEDRIVGHSSRTYYLDCPVGQKIRILAENEVTSRMYGVHEMADRHLLGYWNSIYASLGVHPQTSHTFPLGPHEREEVEEDIRVTLFAQVAHEIAGEQPEKCASFSSGCYLCPKGREIIAREVYEYAMGGSGFEL